MIYLDTHVLVWLFTARLETFTNSSKQLMNDHNLYISPVVRLELQYLYDIDRITVEANEIVTDLAERVGLRICDKDFNRVITQAMKMDWTRDPFDRLISAQAAIDDDILISKDRTILDNYAQASW